jgi:hypothetical protein
MTYTTADANMSGDRGSARSVTRCAAIGGGVAAVILTCLVSPLSVAASQSSQSPPALRKTYLPLAEGHETGANALLIEPAKPGPKSRIVMINSHPKNRNNFEYFIGDVFAARGYRVIEVNIYDE